MINHVLYNVPIKHIDARLYHLVCDYFLAQRKFVVHDPNTLKLHEKEFILRLSTVCEQKAEQDAKRQNKKP